MLSAQKNRIYGKTKELDIVTLQKSFKDDRASFISVALLFGSRALGTHHSRSDYDFAFVMDKIGDEPWGVKAKAYCVVGDLLDLDDCDFDIVDLRGADKIIIDSIKEGYVLLKGDECEVSRLLGKNG